MGLAQNDGARGIGESHTIEGQRLEVNDSVSMPCQSGNGGLKLAGRRGLAGVRVEGSWDLKARIGVRRGGKRFRYCFDPEIVQGFKHDHSTRNTTAPEDFHQG